MTPDHLKIIKCDVININDTIYVMEEGTLVEYKITSRKNHIEYWIQYDAVHVKTGLETILKFNPKVQNDIYRSYLGDAWIAMSN